MRHNYMKRVSAIFLAVAMMVAGMSVMSFAAGVPAIWNITKASGEEVSGGTATYTISGEDLTSSTKARLQVKEDAWTTVGDLIDVTGEGTTQEFSVTFPESEADKLYRVQAQTNGNFMNGADKSLEVTVAGSSGGSAVDENEKYYSDKKHFRAKVVDGDGDTVADAVFRIKAGYRNVTVTTDEDGLLEYQPNLMDYYDVFEDIECTITLEDEDYESETITKFEFDDSGIKSVNGEVFDPTKVTVITVNLIEDSDEWDSDDFEYGEYVLSTQTNNVADAVFPGDDFNTYLLPGTKNVITGFSEAGLEKLEAGNTDLVIPAKDSEGNPVQGIGYEAFKATSEPMKSLGVKLTSVEIPEGVTTKENVEDVNAKWGTAGYLTDGSVDELGDFFIGYGAFRANDIKELVLPEGVIKLNTYAFADNANLTKVTFPKTIAVIGQGAFYKCGIDTLTFPEKTDLRLSVYPQAFMSNKIASLTFPKDVLKCDKMAFIMNKGSGIAITSGTAAEKKGELVTADMKSDSGNISGILACTNNAGCQCLTVNVIVPTYTITFDAGKGTVDVETVQTKNGKIEVLPEAKRGDCEFLGWFTEETGGEKITEETVFDKDTTVYAQFNVTPADELAETVNALPATVTVDDKEAVEAAVAEYEALSEEDKAAVSEITLAKLDAAVAKLEAAEATAAKESAEAEAEQAKKDAEAAQKEAEQAKKDAEAAQKEAEQAKKDAEAAQKEAEQAKKDAEAAQKKADEAEAKAAEAEKAKEEAEASSQNSGNKAAAMSDLVSDVLDAQKVAQSDYKSATAEPFNTALEAAQAVLKDKNSDEAALKKADSDLKAAAEALVLKDAQKPSVKAATKTVKAAKVKRAKKTVKAITVKNTKGTVTYKKAGGSAKLTVNAKTGKVTVKKGTKKGLYKINVKVSASGNGDFKAWTGKTTVKVRVK